MAIGEAESLIYLTYPGVLAGRTVRGRGQQRDRFDEPARGNSVNRQGRGRASAESGQAGGESDETIRVVTIQGFDAIACSGSHVDRPA